MAIEGFVWALATVAVVSPVKFRVDFHISPAAFLRAEVLL
jgi:hypothetical protein